eukprot:NODE_52_length_30984_cov_1.383358.p20 type:complete len:237 gc:universal NODE_52_length_30984_cov_1.383358:26983-26273(-)
MTQISNDNKFGGIFEAAFLGHFHKVEKLSDQLELKDLDGRTALHWAVVGMHTKIVQFILSKIDISLADVSDDGGFTPFLLSCATTNLEIVQLLTYNCKVDLGKTSKTGQSALHFAASKGSIPIAQLLLDNKPDLINAVDKYQQSPLHRCSSVGNRAMVELLCSRGAKQLKDSEGNLPIHLACELSNGEVVVYLAANFGKSIHSRNNNGLSPIDCCNSKFKSWLIPSLHELGISIIN